jgi:nucleotide-binding universal stress UspA family protein
MDRALVVVNDSEKHRTLLREAGELAAGVGAELVVLTTLTPEEFDQDSETIEAIARIEHASYDEDPIEGARNFVSQMTREVLDDVDVETEAVAQLIDDDEHADAVLDVAADENCDHVFITGRRRSPTGKALFGDSAQRVILNFDGPVTVRTS